MKSVKYSDFHENYHPGHTCWLIFLTRFIYTISKLCDQFTSITTFIKVSSTICFELCKLRHFRIIEHNNYFNLHSIIQVRLKNITLFIIFNTFFDLADKLRTGDFQY